MGSRYPMGRGNYEGRRGTHCKVYGHSTMSYAKTAEPIENPLGVWTRVGPRKHVLGGGAYWRHLANTTELSMCSSDAACYQITLTSCYYY